jgi:hypothetical protein
MKVAVLISTCWKDKLNGGNEAIRQTWGKNLPKGWDLKFCIGDREFTKEEKEKLFTNDFIGSPGTLGNMDPSKSSKCPIGQPGDLRNDELLLPCDDGYLGLPWKTTTSLEWALERGYDFIVRGFVDTYLFPQVMVTAKNLWDKDAAGWSFGCGPCPAHPTLSHSCPLGGAGYTNSRKAAEAVVNEPIRHWGEDTHTGFALHNAGIDFVDDHRFVWDDGIPVAWNRVKFAIHMCDRGRKWVPQEMIAKHRLIETERAKYPGWDGTCRTCGHDRFRFGFYGPACRHCGDKYAAAPAPPARTGALPVSTKS